MSKRLQLLTQILDQSPNDSFALFAIAKEHEGLGDAAQAFVFYNKLRQTDPDYVGLYYHLGKLYEKNGDIDAALEIYRTGMGIAKKMRDFHALNELAGARMQFEDIDDED